MVWTVNGIFFFFLPFLGVTGLVTTDDKNARNIDVNLWAMTDQKTGEYGVRNGHFKYFTDSSTTTKKEHWKSIEMKFTNPNSRRSVVFAPTDTK